MDLEERQVSKQIHSLINIAEENICMSKTYWFVKSVLSLRQNDLKKESRVVH